MSPFCLGMVADPRTVGLAFEMGINFFFVTADMHWPLYDAARRGLADLLATPGVRDRVVVAAVAYATQPEFCHATFREVIDAVPGLGRIDVTVAGGSYVRDFPTRAPQFRLHGPLGARAFGVSFHDRKLARKVLVERLADVGFVRYNTHHLGAEKDVFRHLRPSQPGRALVYNFNSTRGYLRPEGYAALGLAPRFWRPEITDHYRFVLGRPEIDGVLCSPRTPSELAALESALGLGPLMREEERYLRDLADVQMQRAVPVNAA